eukprot:1200124-Amphidinium_carterae.1
MQPNCRCVLMQDSRVVIGATARGRSSSKALNHVAATQLPYILGGCLYPGAIHVPTEIHRADDPSRFRPVRPPSMRVPGWLQSLFAGDCELFDCVVQADEFSWPCS